MFPAPIALFILATRTSSSSGILKDSYPSFKSVFGHNVCLILHFHANRRR